MQNANRFVEERIGALEIDKIFLIYTRSIIIYRLLMHNSSLNPFKLHKFRNI